MALFIQRKSEDGLETVDEFNAKREALEALKEYRISDKTAHYYLSSRACKEWKNK